MYIRETSDSDINDILFVERNAFNSGKEADLTRELLADPTAKPLLSLMAFIDGAPAGHILFTAAHFLDAPKIEVSFLAPLAVIPRFQRQGVGSALVKNGLEILSKLGVRLVFAVGHPEYYPRFGFTPAGKFGFGTPHPFPEEHADAWMVNVLRPDVVGSVSGKLICCEALNKPEIWRE
jgi:putative acetyltransferase